MFSAPGMLLPERPVEARMAELLPDTFLIEEFKFPLPCKFYLVQNKQTRSSKRCKVISTSAQNDLPVAWLDSDCSDAGLS